VFGNLDIEPSISVGAKSPGLLPISPRLIKIERVGVYIEGILAAGRPLVCEKKQEAHS
jgi:hypothetical protein